MSIPLYVKRLFHSGKVSRVYSSDPNIMPCEKIRVLNCGFNVYIPAWSSSYNGHISRVKPTRSEESGTSVLVIPLCQISSWNTNTCLVLNSFPWKLHQIKSVCLTLSLLFSLLQFLLNPHAPILPVVSLDEIYQQVVNSKSLPKIFSNYSVPLSSKTWWSRKNTCVCIEIFQLAIWPKNIPFAAIHSEPLTISIIRNAVNNVPYLTQNQNIFNHGHIWALAIITLLQQTPPGKSV